MAKFTASKAQKQTRASPSRKGAREARVCLLIPTRALPLMSYRVPESLHGRVDVGSAVVVPLSGYSRLGIVIEMGEADPARNLEEIRRVPGGLSLGPELVGLCRWVSENATLPLSVVLRNALPPGLRIDLYRVTAPDTGPWRRGTMVERGVLRKSLGKDGLKEAEADGRIVLSPATARRESVEWIVPGEGEPDLSRAPRQRELFRIIRSRGICRARQLLEETGARRETLKELANRGAIRLERRSGSSPVDAARGLGKPSPQPPPGLIEALDQRGAYLQRVPGKDQTSAVAGLCMAAVERWEQTLVLAPEIRDVERLVGELTQCLPAGTTVAPYHSGLGRERATVYEAARQGAVDVLVGTRAAAMLPLSRPGAICVVDEPNSAHRAEPGFEGIPLHVREIALERARREDAAALMLSPAPSLTVYAAVQDGPVRDLEAPGAGSWPEMRVVDMRGSGATISRELLEACGVDLLEVVEEGGVGMMVDRLGYATAVSCAGCGAIVACRNCGLPAMLHGGLSGDSGRGEMVCNHCATRSPVPGGCSACGSERLTPTGLGVDRARELLAGHLGENVGLATAGRAANRDSRVVVGTAHEILSGQWDTVLVPDADSLLFGGGMFAAERGFQTLYSAAESATRRIVVQTRDPGNTVLRSALRGDYPEFASHELPRRRRAKYPPYFHLASLNLEGSESAVKGAIESLVGSGNSKKFERSEKSGVEALDPVPVAKAASGYETDPRRSWRVILRSRRRPELARALSAAAEIPSAGRNRRPSGGAEVYKVSRVKIELDPEEV